MHCVALELKKQPLRGVLIKSCTKNMQQISRKAPMPKCGFNKVAKPFIENTSERLLVGTWRLFLKIFKCTLFL